MPLAARKILFKVVIIMAKNKNSGLKIAAAVIIVIAAAVAAYFAYSYFMDDINGSDKPADTVTVEIGDGATDYDVSQKLYSNGIIESDTVWSYWLDRHYPELEYIPGEYEFNASMSYEEIVAALGNPVVTHKTVKVTIPEGYDVFTIAAALEGSGVCTADDFKKACADKGSYDYSFISDIPESSTIAYPLEGFLFPATYEFQENMPADQVVDEMLGAFADRITQQWRSYCEDNSMTLYELVTLASVVEKETLGEGVAENIASVFINRLKIGQQLQSDVTIDYGNKLREAGFDDNTVSSYNTYKCSALPAGPICNPGVANIDAVVNHSDTDYYYFFSYNNGADFYFTDNYDDFQREWAKLGGTNTQ